MGEVKQGATRRSSQPEGSDQKGDADGKGDVGKRQQGGEQAAQPAHPGTPVPLGEQQGGGAEGPQGGGPATQRLNPAECQSPGWGARGIDWRG